MIEPLNYRQLIALLDHVTQLNEQVGLSPETLTEVGNAISKEIDKVRKESIGFVEVKPVEIKHIN